VGYAGRISPEKGVGTLLQAAALCPQIAFQLAGRIREGFPLPRPLPANVTLLGHLEGEALASFYRGARMIVTPSECFETFGMSTAEALLHRRPVIASRIGVLPEFVRDGVDGLLFEPGNAAELADRIRYLWDRPELCRPMGRAGRERALAEYSPQRVYPGLMAVFEQARAAPVGGR
jgi:glycosyltransferase involved in cell wall biosynthesis